MHYMIIVEIHFPPSEHHYKNKSLRYDYVIQWVDQTGDSTLHSSHYKVVSAADP